MPREQTTSIELVEADTVRQVSTAVMIAALTAVLAQFSIQLPGGVPFSFQPFGIFVAGLLLGPLWGGFSISLYVLVGLAGAPVYSNGGAGLGYVLGPTGGFLVGFLVAAAVIGLVAHRSLQPTPVADLSAVSTTTALLAGIVVVYLIGVPWLAAVNGLAITQAASAMALFAVGDLLKIGIASGSLLAGTNCSLICDDRRR